ncbi:MAG: YtxH domain-containing protein [Bacteroidota bacterium]
MSDSKKNNGLFWLGLGIGVVAGYLLNSDRGRRIQQDASEKAKVYGQQIKETGQQQVDQLTQNVNKWVQKGQFYAKDLQTLTKSSVDKINPMSISAEENAFERGARKAKAAIELQEQQIEQAIEKGTL